MNDEREQFYPFKGLGSSMTQRRAVVVNGITIDAMAVSGVGPVLPMMTDIGAKWIGIKHYTTPGLEVYTASGVIPIPCDSIKEAELLHDELVNTLWPVQLSVGQSHGSEDY